MSTQLLGAEKEASVQKVNKNSHPFIPNTSESIRLKMLEAIGVGSIEELYSDIPAEVRVSHPLKIPAFNSEHEVLTHIEALLSQNQSTKEIPTFLGAGIYNHGLHALPSRDLSGPLASTVRVPVNNGGLDRDGGCKLLTL